MRHPLNRPNSGALRLTYEQAHRLFSYDPETGVLTWRIHAGRKIRAGARAGTLDRTGYRKVAYQGKVYKEHRLIWLLCTGCWPINVIDHINRNRSDNRIANLRDVDKFANGQNRVKPGPTNLTRLIGASFDKKANRWRAQITVRRSRRVIGYFDSALDAHQAYMQAKRELHLSYSETEQTS